MPSGRHTVANPRENYCITQETGVAGVGTRQYYFYNGQTYRFEGMQYAADACDGTDYFTPELAFKGPNDTSFTVISTGSACQTADTIINYTTLDSTAPVEGIIPAGSTIRVKLTFANTFANVKGVSLVAKFSLAH